MAVCQPFTKYNLGLRTLEAGFGALCWKFLVVYVQTHKRAGKIPIVTYGSMACDDTGEKVPGLSDKM